MTKKKQKIELKISSGKNSVKKYNDKLRKAGFKFSSGRYLKLVPQTTDLKKYSVWCKKRGLSFSWNKKKYTRNTSYRSKYFRNNYGILHSSIFLCAYCGKPIRKKKVVVDHLVSIKSCQENRIAKLYIKLFCNDDVNDIKNLVPSCKKCNLKKGTDTGLWWLLGKLGKHRVFWYFILLTSLFSIILIMTLLWRLLGEKTLHF